MAKMTIEQVMKRYSYDQLKEMYSKDRKIVQDRLYRLGKTEFSQSKTYRKYNTKLPRVRDLKTKEELAAAFMDTDKLIQSGFTTISKQRQQKQRVLAGLHENNFDFITEENYWDFYNLMEWYENKKLKPVYGSPTDEALTTYLDKVKSGMDPEELRQLLLEYLETGKGEFKDYL